MFASMASSDLRSMLWVCTRQSRIATTKHLGIPIYAVVNRTCRCGEHECRSQTGTLLHRLHYGVCYIWRLPSYGMLSSMLTFTSYAPAKHVTHSVCASASVTRLCACSAADAVASQMMSDALQALALRESHQPLQQSLGRTEKAVGQTRQPKSPRAEVQRCASLQASP